MLVLYPLALLDRRQPDDVYAVEAAVADRLQIPWALMDHDHAARGEAERAVRRVAVQPLPVIGLYRGWMLTADHYALFYQALEARGVLLVNDPAAYAHCHHLPASYAVIEGHTPRTVWLSWDGGIDMGRVMDLLRPFGDAPLVLKDFVKSQKHAWDEACFIPSASDQTAVERVVRRFVELQGPDLVGGLVFREFVELEPLGRHPQSGMPLTLEYRLFFLDGRLLSYMPYWGEAGDEGEAPPVDQFAAIASKVRSRFFTMDVAKRRSGGWLLVELGDGQVAGLPEGADAEAFYRGLAVGLTQEG